MLLVPRPRRFWGKFKKKKKSVGVLFDRTATTRMDEGVEMVGLRVVADGNMCLPYHALPAMIERNKTFANALEELSSVNREDSSASFDAVVPKAVEKVVVNVQKDPKPAAVQVTECCYSLPVVATSVRFGFFIT